jgi:hypothetical protein
MTPDVETMLSTSFNPLGTVPSAKRRLPEPTTTGNTNRWNSSIRLARRSVCSRFQLP